MENNLVVNLEANIRQALKDYGAHTDLKNVMNDVSDSFVKRLAMDSAEAKSELRELFRKSPVWNEELQALVINGTRTHNPNYSLVCDLAYDILIPAVINAETYEKERLIRDTIGLFISPKHYDYEACKEEAISAINKLAPKAYAPRKKLSRVFKALCDALGVSDENAGSEFQRLFAQFADELSAKKIDFKLYVSINPGHFLTMSNPKEDDRGTCMTSCHSFNYTEYPYNNGCSGYARDSVSFIVFTVADPKNPETLNNRKTTRQIFAYKPGNGLLLQSRLYNTGGGTRGAQEESKIYRDLVQREISCLEGAVNLWSTHKVCTIEHRDDIIAGVGFGGYHDWEYEDFDARVSIRKDHIDNYSPLVIGTYGLCIKCGTKISRNLYCDDCKKDKVCDDCDEYTDEVFTVYADGEERHVCRDCFVNYSRCDICGRYHHDNEIRFIDGRDVCPECFNDYYRMCSVCGTYHLRGDMNLHTDENGIAFFVCDDCENGGNGNEN